MFLYIILILLFLLNIMVLTFTPVVDKCSLIGHFSYYVVFYYGHVSFYEFPSGR